MDNIEIIRKCLPQIRPEALDYAQWLQVGSAIKHEGGTCEMWDSWSASDKRHRKNDCTGRWANLDKGSDSVTVATIVRLCKEHGGTVPGMPEERYSGDDWADEIPMDSPVQVQYRKDQQQNVSDQRVSDDTRIVRREWLEIERLPQDDGSSGAEELAKYIRALFSDEDHVGYVTGAFQTEPDASGARKWVPDGKGVYSDTARELLAALSRCKGDLGSVVGDWEEECGAWIRFNPLDGNGVQDSNVTDYRYALVESDEIPIDEQWTIVRKLELPVVAVVHSGKKSLHAIVRIDASDYREYQKRVDQLYDICRKNGLQIDRKNRNPSRLSRMPGVTRNGVRQRLVAVNIGKDTWKEWQDWLASQNDELPDFEDMAEAWDNTPPLAECIIEGVLRKGHKMLVSGPSKAGKSFLLLELAEAIAEGGEWLGWKCQQGKVLYVNLELDRASCMHRIKDIYARKGVERPKQGSLEIWNLRGQAIPMDKLVPKLIRRAMKTGVNAVILDPIYKVITGDENAADQMAHFCNQFDKVCNELGCAFIYCHHHSKGEQGQKAAMDRASGSGVFARDPDALIDIVELDIDEKRREQIQNDYSVMAVQSLLDERCPDWRDGMEPDIQEKLADILELARRKVGYEADRVNTESIHETETMTGWRISGILREFPAFKARFAFFRYPIHDSGSHVEPLLQDCKAKGEIRPMTKAERIEAGKAAADEARQNTVNETIMAFDALDDGEVVTTKRVAEYLGVAENSARRRLKNAGFVQPEGAVGVWKRGVKKGVTQ